MHAGSVAAVERSPARTPIPRGTRGAPRPSPRLVHLDNLKIALTAGVIVAHAAMSYGAIGSWVYEEQSLSDPLATVLGAMVVGGALFGLGLFYLMAGLLSTGSLARQGAGRFMVARLWRLAPPLVAYAIVVWPVLRWLVERVEADDVSLWAFYRREFSASNWTSAGTGPLWFVAVLLVATAAWSLWRGAYPAPDRAGAGGLGTGHLVLAATTVAVGSFLVRLEFPVDSPQFLDLHVWLWPQAIVLFALGAISAERGWLDAPSPDIRRTCRRLALAAAGSIGLVVLLSSDLELAEGGWHWEAAGLAAAEGVLSVTLSILVLDWFRRHLARHRPGGRRMARAAYGAFVAQGPVLVLIALALRPVDLPGDLKFLVLALTSVTISFGLVMIGQDLADRVQRPPTGPG